MPLSEPDPDSSESEAFVASSSPYVRPPYAPDREVRDRGDGMTELHAKDAGQRLFYSIDMRPYLLDGEAVSGASATVSPVTAPEMAIQRMEFSRDAVLVWLSGGADAVRYLVRTTVRTSGRRSWLITFAIITNGDAEPGAIIHISAEQLTDSVAAGVAPQLALAPAVIAFPATASDAISAPVAVTVTNIGGRLASIRSIVPIGPFTFSSDAEGQLEPGESFTLLVRFKPVVAGNAIGRIILSGNAPVTLALSGRAT